MYNKLYSHQLDKSFCKYMQAHIKEIIGDRLDQKTIDSIIESYRYQFYNDRNFKVEYFLLDLKSYLKYLELSNAFSYPLKRIGRIKRNYFPNADYCQSVDCNKKIYLDPNTNKIVRSHYLDPIEFFWQKLIGINESAISKLINNNLLVASCNDIPGEPVDVVERILLLEDILLDLWDESILEKLETARESNVLITDFSRDISADAGLAVRFNEDNKKRVYVVAFNLKFRKLPTSKEAIKEMILKIQSRCEQIAPYSLDYGYLVKYIPQLSDLTPQFNSKFTK